MTRTKKGCCGQVSLSSTLYYQRRTKVVSLQAFGIEAGLSPVNTTVLMTGKLPHLGAMADLLAGLGVRHWYFLSSFNWPPSAPELSARLASGYSFLFKEVPNRIICHCNDHLSPV